MSESKIEEIIAALWGVFAILLNQNDFIVLSYAYREVMSEKMNKAPCDGKR